MVDQLIVLLGVPRHLRGNLVPVHPMGKIMAEVGLTPLRLGPVPQLMDLLLLLALEPQRGEGRQQTHQPLGPLMMHPLQGDRTTTFPLHTVVLRLLQLQLLPRDTETKRRRQQRPRAPIENHCEITDLTPRRHDTTLLHRPPAHQHQLHTEVVTMHRRQPPALETAQGTLTAMRSNIGPVPQYCNH